MRTGRLQYDGVPSASMPQRPIESTRLQLLLTAHHRKGTEKAIYQPECYLGEFLRLFVRQYCGRQQAPWPAISISFFVFRSSFGAKGLFLNWSNNRKAFRTERRNPPCAL
jgi:hypothetical protein